MQLVNRVQASLRRRLIRGLGILGGPLPLTERMRLVGMPRRTPTTVRFAGLTFDIVDAASFLSAFRSIFERKEYALPLSAGAPRILDCGANVGLAVAFWKLNAPAASITAFEPDPDIVGVLRGNCRRFGWADVEVVEKALWTHSGERTFETDGADGGRLIDEASSGRSVATVRLADVLAAEGTDVDLLKIDIEGAEVEVIIDAAGELARVRRLFVEYHGFVGQPQRLDELLGVVRGAGFRFYVHEGFAPRRPFLERRDDTKMDQRVNIFAVRG